MSTILNFTTSCISNVTKILYVILQELHQFVMTKI